MFQKKRDHQIYFRYDWLLWEFQFNTREVFSLNHFHMLFSYLILPPHQFLENWSSEIIIRDCSNKLESGNKTFFGVSIRKTRPSFLSEYNFMTKLLWPATFESFINIGHWVPRNTNYRRKDPFLSMIYSFV